MSASSATPNPESFLSRSIREHGKCVKTAGQEINLKIDRKLVYCKQLHAISIANKSASSSSTIVLSTSVRICSRAYHL